MNPPNWGSEFSRVISCEHCNQRTCKKILRDPFDNLPQPGFIGQRFVEKRILLVGQNPGVSTKSQAENDRQYLESLRRLRDEESEESWDQLQRILSRVIPTWPVNGSYFPLEEAGLSLDEIAYFNIVRCRTERNSEPSASMVSNCVTNHFIRWLELLNPKAVVFIGKWAHGRAACYLAERSIPCRFMNRERSLSSSERLQNRRDVVAFIRNHTN